MLSLVLAGCTTPVPPTIPSAPQSTDPAPTQRAQAVESVTFAVRAEDVLRAHQLAGLTVEVDSNRAIPVGGGQFQALVPIGDTHAVRLTRSGYLPLEWHGPLSDRTRLTARLCPDGIRVVGFGDSLTAGLKVDTASRFVMKLVGLIQGARPGFWVDFRDAGHSGDTYASALARLGSDVLAANPDVTIVEFGSNDVLKTPIDQFPATMDALLKKLTTVSPVTLVADIPYKPRWYGSWNQQTAPFDEAIAAGALRHHATPIALSERFRAAAGAGNWDLFVHDAPYDESMPDSRLQGDIHPNAAGNELMATTFAEAILQATAPSITASP